MDHASPSLLIEISRNFINNQWFSSKQIQIHRYPSKIDQIHLLSDFVVEPKSQDKNFEQKETKRCSFCALARSNPERRIAMENTMRPRKLETAVATHWR